MQPCPAGSYADTAGATSCKVGAGPPRWHARRPIQPRAVLPVVAACLLGGRLLAATPLPPGPRSSCVAPSSSLAAICQAAAQERITGCIVLPAGAVPPAARSSVHPASLATSLAVPPAGQVWADLRQPACSGSSIWAAPIHAGAMKGFQARQQDGRPTGTMAHLPAGWSARQRVPAVQQY